NVELHTSFCLLVDERPVARSALCILFCLRCVVERELDVMEGAKFRILKNSNTVTVGSNGELDWFCLQVGKDCLEVRMHAILTGAEINRAHGQAIHDSFDLIERKPVRTSRVAIAKGAGEITFVGKTEPKRNVPGMIASLRIRFTWPVHCVLMNQRFACQLTRIYKVV